MIGQVLNDIRHVPGYVFNKKTKTTRKTQAAQLRADREKREANAECRTEMQVYDCLYFLVKAKSSYQWQLPLIEMLDDLREACMEQSIEVNITRRAEVSKLVANLTNQYVT